MFGFIAAHPVTTAIWAVILGYVVKFLVEGYRVRKLMRSVVGLTLDC
jgi:hypothetical protein